MYLCRDPYCESLLLCMLVYIVTEWRIIYINVLLSVIYIYIKHDSLKYYFWLILVCNINHTWYVLILVKSYDVAECLLWISIISYTFNKCLFEMQYLWLIIIEHYIIDTNNMIVTWDSDHDINTLRLILSSMSLQSM